MPCRFRNPSQRKAVMAKLKSRYTKHSNPCTYCSHKNCKSCTHNKRKFSLGHIPLKKNKGDYWKTHI